MKVVLATIRDRANIEVARILAFRENDQFVVQLAVPDEHASWRERLSELSQGKLRLMINGVVCLEKHVGETRKLVVVDEVVARVSGGEARLVYDPEGIEQGHQLKSEIAKQQDHCVPFSDLVDILHQSAGTG